MTPRRLDRAHALLCRLQDSIHGTLIAARDAQVGGELAEIAEVTAADTIYRIDRISEAAIVAWFEARWPADWPVELVMGGAVGGDACTVPRDTPVARTEFTTGGQIFELLIGHDRMLGVLRPLAFRRLGFASALVCHPYDIRTAMLLQEAGGVAKASGVGRSRRRSTGRPRSRGWATPTPGWPIRSGPCWSA